MDALPLLPVCFTVPPCTLHIPQRKALPFGSSQSPRASYIVAQIGGTLRRILLATRLPNVGLGALPRFIPSIRHPDLNLFTLTWLADGTPKAGLLISPGLVWHSGWFSAIGNALSKAGVTTVALDGVGMGRSDSLRGVRGLITDMADHVDELSATLLQLEKDMPAGVPLFVLGESSGGISAVLMAMGDEVKDKVSGFILCAPAIRVRKELLPPRAVLKAVKVLATLWPGLPLPGEKVSGETWDQAFGDKRCAEVSKKDPLVGYGDALRIGTATCFTEAMDEIEEALDKGELAMRNVLVLHNEGDVRTDFGDSKRFVERVVCQGKAALIEPGGMGHQLFQDKAEITAEVTEKIVQFVAKTADAT